ncbi:hypothetical protein niasHT_019680 [Heterodera trifolii]|uniref:Uncharacterized protein n=1 Tax=Heterodera trifolii TaxID=157864 RepID=A0ABD2LLX2_9BILA
MKTKHNTFYVAAFDNWKQETLTTYSIQLPKYVEDIVLMDEDVYISDTVVREAKDEMEQLLAQVQLEARREFQSESKADRQIQSLLWHTLKGYSIQLPKYVEDIVLMDEDVYISDTVVREAKDEMEQLLAQVQLEARREFQSESKADRQIQSLLWHTLKGSTK